MDVVCKPHDRMLLDLSRLCYNNSCTVGGLGEARRTAVGLKTTTKCADLNALLVQLYTAVFYFCSPFPKVWFISVNISNKNGKHDMPRIKLVQNCKSN